MLLRAQPILIHGKLWLCGVVFVEEPSSAADLSLLLVTASHLIWQLILPSLLEPTPGKSAMYQHFKMKWYHHFDCLVLHIGAPCHQLGPSLGYLRPLSRRDLSRPCTGWVAVWPMAPMASSLTLPSLRLTLPSPWTPMLLLPSCPLQGLQLEPTWLSADGAPQLKV